MKNTGTDFELITQKIYQALLDCDYSGQNFRKINVQHNVVLQGKSGNTHQIDVYWEFELAGLVYKTIIEVKDWKNPIPQTLLHSFKSVIDDIPGAVKGIFVSRCGFQSGAKVYADANGINLVQISKEFDDTELSVRVSHTTTYYVLKAIGIDEHWYKTQSVSTDEIGRCITEAPLEETYVLNPKGDKVRLFDLMCMEAVPYYTMPEGERHTIKRRLHGDWYWISEDAAQRVKIAEYSFECYNTCVSMMLYLTIRDFPTYCLTNIFTQEEHRCSLSPQHNTVRLLQNQSLPMICL